MSARVYQSCRTREWPSAAGRACPTATGVRQACAHDLGWSCAGEATSITPSNPLPRAARPKQAGSAACSSHTREKVGVPHPGRAQEAHRAGQGLGRACVGRSQRRVVPRRGAGRQAARRPGVAANHHCGVTRRAWPAAVPRRQWGPHRLCAAKVRGLARRAGGPVRQRAPWPERRCLGRLRSASQREQDGIPAALLVGGATSAQGPRQSASESRQRHVRRWNEWGDASASRSDVVR